jgi:hypothetical protein
LVVTTAGGDRCAPVDYQGRFVVALTFRRRLELAWFLSKVESHLQRLHLLKKPKRHVARDVALVGSTFAAGVVVAGVVCGRRGWSRGASAVNGGGAPAASSERPAAEPDWEVTAADADRPRDFGPPAPVDGVREA